MERRSNYDIFREEALKRFLTYDPLPLQRRLNLQREGNDLLVSLFSETYRLSVAEPVCLDAAGKPAGVNAVLTLCDLLCHSEQPLLLSPDYKSLASLNRVKGGTTSTTLVSAGGSENEKLFDKYPEALAAACEALGGIRMGKGDVAYRIPLHGDICVQLEFYCSDEEFPPQVTFLFPENVCDYLFFETLYYAIGLLLSKLKAIMGGEV